MSPPGLGDSVGRLLGCSSIAAVSHISKNLESLIVLAHTSASCCLKSLWFAKERKELRRGDSG